MSGYAKLASTLVLSTVWREPHTVRIVWITMLALADASGYVAASLPGLADAARVELPECEAAIRCFLSPDRYSRSKAHEGRRIAEVDGGWVLLNYEVYRGGRDPETRRRQNREAQARHRDAQPVSHGQPRSATRKPESAQAEAEAEAEAKTERGQSDRRAGLDLGPAAADGDFKLQPEPAKPHSQRDADVLWVFEAWKQDTGHHKSKIDNKRKARIGARLREGFTREQLRDAILNRRNDRFLMGQNADGRVFDGIQTLLRDRDQVERLLRLTTAPTPAPQRQHHGGGNRAGDLLPRQMERARELRAAEERERREQLALPGKVLS